MAIQQTNHRTLESSAENDRRIMTLVAAARQQSVADRDTFLRHECRHDPELHRQVVEILVDEEQMGSFLLHPVIVAKEPHGPFEPGQVVERRFEIVREIGAGGMGIVYEAFDRKRGVRIAIKAAKPGFRRLLTPELESALTVRHANVCRVNEIHTAHTEHGEIDFLAMELLEGETLHARLKFRGKFEEKEALEIARQLCAGVAEAHRSGVIHRDLKSANIFLCEDKNGKLRAVITDFGLAGSVTERSGLGGTPEYMAPELWQGERATPASDLYALGAILYELITGCRPFEKIEPGDIASRSSPKAPSKLAPRLSSQWDRVLLRCLDPVPARRPRDAGEISAALTARPWPPRKAFLIVLPLLLSAVLASPFLRDWIWPASSVRLAILPAITDVASAELAAGVLQDVADRVKFMRTGRRTVAVIAPSDALDAKIRTPSQARELLHATHALQTSMRREGDDIATQVAVIDLETQSHVRELTARYSAATLGSLPTALAGQVSLALQLQNSRNPETLAPRAVTLYEHALNLLRTADDNFDQVIPMFQQATRLDPQSPLPWAGLAEAQLQKFRVTKQRDLLLAARTSVQQAETLNPDSVRVRLMAGLVNKSAGQYMAARRDFQRVQELEPRNIDGSLEIARIYDLMDEPEEAIKNFNKAIALEPMYFGAYQALATFYYYRGNYAQSAAYFKIAIECAPGRYEEYAYLGATLTYLGEDAAAKQAFLKSLQLKESPFALTGLGVIEAYQRQDAAAILHFARAVKLDPRNRSYTLNLGDAYRRTGRAREAALAYRQGLELVLAELNEDARDGLARAFVAYFAARLGDRKRAEDEIEQALSLSPRDTMVMRQAVLTYVALHNISRAKEILRGASAEILSELRRHPDLADLQQ